MADKKFYVGKDELLALYVELGSADKVATRYGVSKKLVLVYMKKYGIARNQKPQREETKERVRILAEQGLTSREIARRASLSLVMVNRYIKELDIDVPRYHKGYTVTRSGYVMVKQPTHPHADSKGYVREHVLVMTAHIGRMLLADEVVHHIDGNKSNNAIENLQLMSDYEHRSYHSSKPRKKVFRVTDMMI